MYCKKRRIEVFIILGLALVGLCGCGVRQDTVAITSPATVSAVVTPNEQKIENLNDIKITLPSAWTKTGNGAQVDFYDENKQIIGGIQAVGYYGAYEGTLPNHSEVISSEDINTSLGKGKLFTLDRSNPAPSNNTAIWHEAHAIIPSGTGTNTAYDIWVIGEKDILYGILKGLNSTPQFYRTLLGDIQANANLSDNDKIIQIVNLFFAAKLADYKDNSEGVDLSVFINGSNNSFNRNKIINFANLIRETRKVTKLDITSDYLSLTIKNVAIAGDSATVELYELYQFQIAGNKNISGQGTEYKVYLLKAGGNWLITKIDSNDERYSDALGSDSFSVENVLHSS